jgi:hypothetical protein
MESKVDGDNATFWVKVADDLSSSPATIYIYYGNPNAATASNLTATFKRVINSTVLALPMDEGSGTTVYDQSGNGNNGTIYNGATWVDGKYGKALSFDGVNDYVKIPYAASLMPPEITVAAWINQKSATDADYKMEIVAPYGGTYAGYALRVGMARVNGLYGNGVNEWQVCSGLTYYSLNTWHLIAMTYKPYNKAVVYLDGNEDREGAIGATAPLAQDRFIGAADIASYVFNGTIDEVRIYSRALTADEISDLYSGYPFEVSGNSEATGKTLIRKYVSPEPAHGGWGVEAADQAPNAPALNSPVAGCRFSPSANAAFTWLFSDNDIGDGQSAFQLQIGDSGFATIYYDSGKTASTGGGATVTLPLNMTVGLYYWRVKTWDSYSVEGAWSSGRTVIVDGIRCNNYTLDLTSQLVTVKAVYAYDAAPIVNANVSYAGLYASTSSSGWATFNVSGLASVGWNTVSYGVSEPTYGLTYAALNQTVAFHKLQAPPFNIRANNQITAPVWDDVNRKLSFTTSGACIVKVGDMGTPLRVEVDGAIYTGWTYNSASQEVQINNLHSNVALIWQSSPSGGGGGAGGGEAGGGGGGGTSGVPVAPPVFVPHEAVPLVNVGLVVIVVVVAGAYAYSQTARPKKVSEKWRQRQKQAKNVEWKKKDRFEE